MKVPQALATDVICILLFAIVGRSSHNESTDLLGVFTTVWPFVVGCVIGIGVSRAWRHPAAIGTGIVVWLCTVVGGITVRLLSGHTAQPAFIAVATVTLGVLLVGWRAGFAVISRARHIRAS